MVEGPVQAGIVFDNSADSYAALYSGLTVGYMVSEGAVLGALIPFLRSRKDPRVLEVGAGTGQSTLRIVKILQQEGLGDIDLVVTEHNQEMIASGKALGEGMVYQPIEQASAEDLSRFGNNTFDALYGSQVVHWIGDVPLAMREAHRVLKPGGMIIHAGSGIIEGFGEAHFTCHPSYKAFLARAEEELRRRGYWQDGLGSFEPVNPVVNPFFHCYSFNRVREIMEVAGFRDVQITAHAVPVDFQEMILRMMPGATSMFIFGGEYARGISKEERAEITDSARISMLNGDSAATFVDLDRNPTGDPAVLFVGHKG